MLWQKYYKQCAKYYYRAKIKCNRINNKEKRVGKIAKKRESSLKYHSSQILRIEGVDFDISSLKIIWSVQLYLREYWYILILFLSSLSGLKGRMILKITPSNISLAKYLLLLFWYALKTSWNGSDICN